MDHTAPPRVAPPRLPTPPRLRGGAGPLVPRTSPTGKAALAIAALARYQRGKPFLSFDAKAGHSSPALLPSPAYLDAGPLAWDLDQKGYDALARTAHQITDPTGGSSVAVALFWHRTIPQEPAEAVVYSLDSGLVVPLPFDVTLDAPWHDREASTEARRAVLQSATAWFGKALLPIGLGEGCIAPWMHTRPQGWGPTVHDPLRTGHVAADPHHNPHATLYQGIALALAGGHDVDHVVLTLRGGVVGPTGRWYVLPEAFLSEPRSGGLPASSQRRLDRIRRRAAAWGRALLLESCATGALPLDLVWGWDSDLDGRHSRLMPYPRHVVGAAGPLARPGGPQPPSLAFPSSHARLSALGAIEAAAPTTMAALRAHPLPRIL